MSIKSTAIFDFLLKNFQELIKFIICNLTYLSLLNSFFVLSRFSVSLKSLNNYFFRWFTYKYLLSRFSVLISYNKDVRELSWLSHGVTRFWFLLNFLFILAFFDILASLSISRVFSSGISGRWKFWSDIPRIIIKFDYIN